MRPAAGLRTGELSTGGSRVASPGQLFQAVASAGAGGRLQLGIVRHNQEQQVTAVPEATAKQMRSTAARPSPRLVALARASLLHKQTLWHL